ncbi:MAG: SulP family inorganic anion transporter [Anaerolineales bacterium]|nr:SulP family inorganic anion transporter [Anaerolineales bacterium]
MNNPTPPSNGIARFIPGLALFSGVNPAQLRTELIVAVTVFAVLVPSAMAYGDLAGVTPVAGLYVALGAMVMYALFGTSKQLVTGPEATTAIMTAAAIAPLAGGDPLRYAALAALAAILVGVLALLARLARLGFITDFLSKPILVGYIFGTTLIVIGSQLGKMFGIKLESDQFFRQVFELISRLEEAHLITVAIGAVSMAVLFTIRRVNRKLPGPLIVVVFAIVLSAVFDLQANGVAIVGAVPAGLPQLTIPAVSLQDIFALLPAALALTILIYADEVLTARVFAARQGQKIDANQEFVAIGMANIGAGFLAGFPAATSASRTTVADQMGGKSQWVGLIAAALIIIFLLFFTPLLAPLPTVVLGAIIIIASFGLLDVATFRLLRRVNHAEFWLAVVTAFGVLTVGILQGILVAVMLSLINVIYHISRPHDALLDDVDAAGGTVYRGVADKETALTEPGLIVYRFDAPLVFANAAFFSERLEELVANAGAGLKCVIFDAEAISDFDSTAAEALENLDADLERLGVELWIARANKPLRDLLLVTGLTTRIGKENIYPSVRAAVTAYHARFSST